ncbi:TetR/AcrR family transcriptional regulator [Corynebacterium sp. YIM 101645]|uniref:TetR/AcrR family transcriptional regulator n=1 Tax=Corynebacterium lemuris TaxID=1859292 RepID=A0ABT2FV45_9CORY|nr:TetR/AcrR family transcriptional regulator [Corynebacterium lemuris]MCS5479114.1 TetR/AcrR family transcriptional regulator [Corynebacterium lemuris]
MSGLRETKKAATRAQIARAAARLALDQGAEGLTVAAVSEAAGVSARTFHNYFAAMDEALREFLVTRVADLIGRLRQAPAEATLFEAVEWVLITGLWETGDDDNALDSFATLFRLSDVLHTLQGAAAWGQLDEQLRPLFEKLANRTSHLSPFESRVAVKVAVTIAQTALESYYALPAPRDPGEAEQLIRRAFDMVRLSDQGSAERP